MRIIAFVGSPVGDQEKEVSWVNDFYIMITQPNTRYVTSLLLKVRFLLFYYQWDKMEQFQYVTFKIFLEKAFTHVKSCINIVLLIYSHVHLIK